MYYSWLLLCVVSLSAFSNVNGASVEKRGLLSSSIKLDVQLGREAVNNASKPVETPGVSKKVIKAPFNIPVSLTITKTEKNNTNETDHDHVHHHGCKHHHKPQPTPTQSTTASPEFKPEENWATIPTSSSTTQNIDEAIGSVFGNTDFSSTSIATPVGSEVGTNDREITGEGKIDVRMPKP